MVDTQEQQVKKCVIADMEFFCEERLCTFLFFSHMTNCRFFCFVDVLLTLREKKERLVWKLIVVCCENKNELASWTLRSSKCSDKHVKSMMCGL